jgi:hypothetical protein
MLSLPALCLCHLESEWSSSGIRSGATRHAEHDVARELQRPLRQQGALVRHILSDVNWADPERLLLRLDDNVGLTQTVRAPVDADLHEVSTTIADEVRTYVQAGQLDRTFGAIFDCAGYLIPSRGRGLSER